jgi:hypothetical protein
MFTRFQRKKKIARITGLGELNKFLMVNLFYLHDFDTDPAYPGVSNFKCCSNFNNLNQNSSKIHRKLAKIWIQAMLNLLVSKVY